MNKILSFYVYEHRRADNGEVFYIGKGSRTKKNRLEELILLKTGTDIGIVL